MPYTATVRPGVVGPGEPGHRVFESNFVVECTCGDSIGVCSLNPGAGEAARLEHLAQHARRGE